MPPSFTKHLIICCLGVCGFAFSQTLQAETFSAGPIYDDFKLTLAPGHRTEIMGPLYYDEQKETQRTWAFPVLTLAHTEDPTIQYSEYDFIYPFLTYDRFGAEYRWQIFQLFSFAGGENPDETHDHRFTLFPIYFQQRSTEPTNNYTAFVPFYGTLKHRLYRDEIHFVMFPGYSRTRKKDVVTYNMPYPFFHLRYGNGLHGWQVWPFMGREHKIVTTMTNGFGETNTVGGHDNLFVLWPFFFDTKVETGTTNSAHQQGLIPFYTYYRSKLRNSTTYFWPLGVTRTVDQEKKYDEWDVPWPLIEFARGDGKHTSRVWPFISHSHNQSLTDNWYAWPIYKYNRINSPPLDRSRMRIMFFLYSDVKERNTEASTMRHRMDLFPFYTWRRDFDGKQRLQVMSILEPFFPNNKSIERDYSPVYAFWRSEHDPKTGADSQSLLWNLYRRDRTPQTKKISLLLGLFQYESRPEGKRWRVCYIPFGKAKKAEPAKQSGQ
jgi:hypothetical protein